MVDSTFQDIDPSVFQSFKYLTIKNCTFLNVLTFGWDNAETVTLELTYMDILQFNLSSYWTLNKLNTLRISGVDIHRIGNSVFQGLASLTQLEIYDCPLEHIAGIAGLKHVRSLFIARTKLQTVHYDAFPDKSAIQDLRIIHSPLKCLFPPNRTCTIAHNIDKLNDESSWNNSIGLRLSLATKFPYLTKLDLSGNSLVILPGNFMFFPSLQRLSLRDNGINQIPAGAFYNLQKLSYLDLYGNKIKTIPSTLFYHLQSLRSLNLAGNSIHITLHTPNTDLGKQFIVQSMENENHTESMFRLSTLHLSDNNLSSIPRHLYKLCPNIQRLELSNCNIQIVDKESFFFLKSIKLINLNDNKIMKLEVGTFKNLSTLERLNLDTNFISHIQQGLLDDLHKLEILDLSNNVITTIDPRALQSLAHLRTLYLRNNDISDLQKHVFRGLQNITRLHLENNLIKCLPSRIFLPLVKLRFINLQSNSLMKIHPGTLLSLASLMTLDLSRNQITTLTKEMVNIPKYLRLLDNPLVCTCDMIWINEIKGFNIGPSHQYTQCINHSQLTVFDYLERFHCAHIFQTESNDDYSVLPLTPGMYVILSTVTLLVSVVGIGIYRCYQRSLSRLPRQVT